MYSSTIGSSSNDLSTVVLCLHCAKLPSILQGKTTELDDKGVPFMFYFLFNQHFTFLAGMKLI